MRTELKPQRTCILLVIAATVFCTSSFADTFTVGPDGTYATIQLGVDAAVASVGTHEVRVQGGTVGVPERYNENVSVLQSWLGDLTISGGWDATFSTRSDDPRVTEVDGGAITEVFDFRPGGGATVTLTGFTIQNGASVGGGGAGVLVNAVNCSVHLTDNIIRQNNDNAQFSSHGGGINVVLDGTAVATIADNHVHTNLASSLEANAAGAGVDVSVSGTATATIERNLIELNTAHTTTLSGSNGCGLLVGAFGAGSVNLFDNVIRENDCTGVGTSDGQGAQVTSSSTGTITMRRSLIHDNSHSKTLPSGSQLVFRGTAGSLLVTDTLVANGDRRGADIQAQGGTPVVRASNLTITGNGAGGLLFAGNGTTNSGLYNSILFDNTGTELDQGGTTATLADNLIGVDPLFVDAVSGDYSLQPTSTAINSGGTPPAGVLGPADIEGAPRVQDGTVDQGAWETACPSCIFAGGFEIGDTSRWS